MKHAIILFILIVICFCVKAYENSYLIKMDDYVTEIKKDYDAIVNDNESLRVKIDSILSLENMDAIAKSKGFHKPTEEDIRNIK